MVSLGLGVYKIWLLLVLLVLRWLKNATSAKKNSAFGLENPHCFKEIAQPRG